MPLSKACCNIPGQVPEKELTDIMPCVMNICAWLIMGLEPKDKSFNADFRMELDPGPENKVISQDIGRVLLNLINKCISGGQWC